jgi:hypothetical protein
MDDILICGKTEDEMMDHLLEVLGILAENNLKIQSTKTKYFQTEVRLLGQIFSTVGRKIDPEKIEAVQIFS